MATLSIIVGRPVDNVPIGIVPERPNYFLCSNPLLYKLQRKDYLFTSRSDVGGFLALTGASNTDVAGFAIAVGKAVKVYNNVTGALAAGLRGVGTITAVNAGTHTFTTDIPYNAGLDTVFGAGWFFDPNLTDNTGDISYSITAKLTGYDLSFELAPDPDGFTIIDISELAKAAINAQGDRSLKFPNSVLSGGSGPEYNRIDVGQSYTDFVELIEKWEDTVHPDGVDIAAAEPAFCFLYGAGQPTDLFKSNLSEYSRGCDHFGTGTAQIYPGNYPLIDNVNEPFNAFLKADLDPGKRTIESIMTLHDLPSSATAKPTIVGGNKYRHPAGDYYLVLGNMSANAWSYQTYVGIILRFAGKEVYRKEFHIVIDGAPLDGDPLSGSVNYLYDLSDVPMFDLGTLYFRNDASAAFSLANFGLTVVALKTRARFLNKLKTPYLYRDYPFTLNFIDQVFSNPDSDVTYSTLRLEVVQYDINGNDVTDYGGGIGLNLSNVEKTHLSVVSRLTIFCKPFLTDDGDIDTRYPYILPNCVKAMVRLRCDASPAAFEDWPILTQWLTINVEEPCDDGILIFWKGWNGADHYYMFSKFFERQHQYQDGRAVRRMLLAAEDLSVDDWGVLNELNSSNLMYRTNITDMNPTSKAQRIGNLVYAVGTDFDITGVIVIPTESKLKNRNERRRIEILVEFPELYQP